MEKIVIDTNIFIYILKGDLKLKHWLDSLEQKHHLIVNTIVHAELIQGSKDKAEIRQIEKYLVRFEYQHIDSRDAAEAIELIRTYSKSHGLLLADALLAGQCLMKGYHLMTRNLKDFRFVPNLLLVQA